VVREGEVVAVRVVVAGAGAGEVRYVVRGERER
jgi:hypothetical protein